MGYLKLSPPERWIIKGIPILFIIGSLMHFLYDFSGENIFVGLIAPVNESVWEHIKLVVIPMILWWSFYYIIKGNRKSINKNRWFTSGLVALVTAMITIPMLYYFYKEAFGVEILIIDIVIFFLAVSFGQLIGLHFYRYSNGIKAYIPISIFILIILIFMTFTIAPPHLPLFKDNNTGQYGVASYIRLVLS